MTKAKKNRYKEKKTQKEKASFNSKNKRKENIH